VSGRVVLQAAVVARLNAVLDVSVFDAPPVRGGLPYAVVDEPVLSDWSTKTWVGREGRAAGARGGGDRDRAANGDGRLL